MPTRATDKPSFDRRVYTSFLDLVSLRQHARGFNFLPRHPLRSDLSGRHVSRLRGRGLNFEELRHYHRGDDVRLIDWRVTQRTGKPFVRTYNEERERNAFVCIDQRQSMFFGSEYEMKSVTAAKLGALSAWRILADNDRVGGIIFSDDGLLVHKPQRNTDAVLRLLRDLERVNHGLSAQATDEIQGNQLNTVLAELAHFELHDALIVLITDWHHWNEETFQWIKRLSQHNDFIGAWVYDRLEQDLSTLEGFIASDGRKQLEITLDDEQLHAAFSQEFDQKLRVLQQQLNRLKLPVLPINTSGKVLQQLISSLSLRD